MKKNKPSFCDFPRKQSLNKLEFEKGAAQEMIFDISKFYVFTKLIKTKILRSSAISII